MVANSPARLILMCGPPGSGKTTLARRLAQQLSAISFSPDEWMTQLGIDLDDPLRDPIGELQYLDVPLHWPAFFEPPAASELALFDEPTRRAGHASPTVPGSAHPRLPPSD